PFMLPFLDNLEKMESNKKGIIKNYLFAEGDESKQKVFFDSIQTMRGRSIDKTFLIADEIQNTDVHIMSAIVNRFYSDSKFVLLCKFAQIHEPSLRVAEKNGFYKLLKGLYAKDPGRKYFNHIHLVENQRSEVVSMISDIFQTEDEVAEPFLELEKLGTIEKLKEVI